MEIPKNLQAEIKSLEEQLTVPKEKLKAITEHFIAELEKGKFASSILGVPSEIVTNT